MPGRFLHVENSGDRVQRNGVQTGRIYEKFKGKPSGKGQVEVMEKTYDLAIAGGGPAGMAAAVQAREEGVERIILLERNSRLGGILPQCHSRRIRSGGIRPYDDRTGIRIWNG